MKMRACAGVLFVSLFSWGWANAGQDGGGGIIIAAEFATTGREAIEVLSQGDSSLNLASILTAIKNTKIIPAQKICHIDPTKGSSYCEDAHYDAVNNMILLDVNRWDKITCEEKMVLSSHEYLRVAGLETEDYFFSGRFLTGRLVKCQGSTREDQNRCADLASILSVRIQNVCRVLTRQWAIRKS